MIAAAVPVWRAVRVAPVEAIRTGFLSAKGGGLAPLLARVPLPGRTTAQMPFRNVLRAPRRTLMTMLGIAAAIVVLIGVIGMVDSFLATIDRGERELTSRAHGARASRSTPSTRGRAVTAIEQSPVVAASELHLPDRRDARPRATQSIDVLLQMVDLDHGIWTPTVEQPDISRRLPASSCQRKGDRRSEVSRPETP